MTQSPLMRPCGKAKTEQDSQLSSQVYLLSEWSLLLWPDPKQNRMNRLCPLVAEYSYVDLREALHFH